jgi:hypothetical protein
MVSETAALGKMPGIMKRNEAFNNKPHLGSQKAESYKL